jgi:hypothetical protein
MYALLSGVLQLKCVNLSVHTTINVPIEHKSINIWPWLSIYDDSDNDDDNDDDDDDDDDC